MRKEFVPQENLPSEIIHQKTVLKSKRRSKRAQIKQSFICQCGKLYLSFSALYLHVKNKHNLKLSTIRGDTVCNIQKINGFSRHKYTIHPENQKENMMDYEEKPKISQQYHISSGELGNQYGKQSKNRKWSEYFNQYLDSIKNVQQSQCIQMFLEYSFDQNQGQDKQLKEKIRIIPYSLNNFALEHLPRITVVEPYSAKWVFLCTGLEKFCKWLLHNKYTDLEVINDVK